MVNKIKRVIQSKYNPFTFISAPLFDERCSYNTMIEYVTISKLKGKTSCKLARSDI